ncbi:SCO2523 family variant P-loop protein [Actinoplanes sichuanensis]|uniref:SCO2523 family variant P-loop protein n=1 Tax=Actinoplanes sichuanensis TaxID=512349 RepID=A0ABW4A8T9_9ACTN|nr:SCO2523 family variant P-loop protein [Actinoplanes sichuanensis]BEL09078.1 SCO2523 family variant P-loop protein [Actinoplanes sichuanensis]
MLVFATSDKGGTGRSVTTSNVAYQSALAGYDVCYLDFDFGSPTAGSVFDIDAGRLGVLHGGLHSYLLGEVTEPHRIDVFAETERESVKVRDRHAGKLFLLPGDLGIGEFPSSDGVVSRCTEILELLVSQFHMCFVDLSAGRSYALQMALEAARRLPDVRTRWLVYHRWTKQHVIAAASLVHGRHGILEAGEDLGYNRDELLASLRFVRTALVDPARPGLTSQQSVWIAEWDSRLQAIAESANAGPPWMLHTVPLDPVLQWREQLITAHDVTTIGIANERTAEAFQQLARLLHNDKAWEVR